MRVARSHLVATLSAETGDAPLSAAVYAVPQTSRDAEELAAIARYLRDCPSAYAQGDDGPGVDFALRRGCVLGVADDQLHVWSADPRTERVYGRRGNLPLSDVAILHRIDRHGEPTVLLTVEELRPIDLTCCGDVLALVSSALGGPSSAPGCRAPVAADPLRLSRPAGARGRT